MASRWRGMPEARAAIGAARARRAALRDASGACDEHGPGSPEERAAAAAFKRADLGFRRADREWAGAVAAIKRAA